MPRLRLLSAVRRLLSRQFYHARSNWLTGFFVVLGQIGDQVTFTASKLVLLVGVILCILGSFGVQFGPMNVFQFGVGVSFASFLVP